MKTIDIKNDTELYLFDNDNFDNTYNVLNGAKLKVFQYVRNISGKVFVNLASSNALVEYHFSTINTDNNTFELIINHNESKTTSNVYNHGINISDNNLDFYVTGKVLKTSSGCIVNQDNQIINLKNGKGCIKPNLLIDNYDISSSHAAYIGELKEESMYYLMSRGISEKKAEQLLIKSILINGGNINNEELKSFLGDNNG